MKRIRSQLWGAQVWTDDPKGGGGDVSMARLKTDHMSGRLQHLFTTVESEDVKVEKLEVRKAEPMTYELKAIGKMKGFSGQAGSVISASMKARLCPKCKRFCMSADEAEAEGIEPSETGHRGGCKFRHIMDVMES